MAPRTVLLVDDSDDNRSVFSTLLEHFGYRVLGAASGSAAISLALAEIPSVILLDISLGDTDGWTVAERLRSEPSTAGIPIIAVTARTAPEDRLRADEVGCAAYLTKPIEPSVLVAEVDRLTG